MRAALVMASLHSSRTLTETAADFAVALRLTHCFSSDLSGSPAPPPLARCSRAWLLWIVISSRRDALSQGAVQQAHPTGSVHKCLSSLWVDACVDYGFT